MTIAAWCDVAWAYILEQAPMMASPTEYRDVLWAALHDGKAPDKAGKGSGGKVTQKDLSDMEALLAQAKALRGEGDDLDS